MVEIPLQLGLGLGLLTFSQPLGWIERYLWTTNSSLLPERLEHCGFYAI